MNGFMFSDSRMTEHSTEKQRQGIQSVEVGTRLLRVLASHGRSMMLKDLAKNAGMAPAKAHRYLTSFIRAGLVAQDAYTGQYDLGSFALELGLSSLARLDIVRAADPVLDRLCEQIDETVGLAVWGSHGATVVRMMEPTTTITVTLRAGAVLPLTKSATGRAFAAFSQIPAVRKALELEIKQLASERNSSIATIREEIDPVLSEIRGQGLSRASGSFTPGINGFSAPVFDFSGQMVASITALGAVGHFDASWHSPIAKELRAAAADLSKTLGHPESASTER